MNFTDKIGCTDTEVELKYCERCGGLFFRLLGASLAYCGGCMARRAALSAIGSRGAVGSWARRKLKPAQLQRAKIERRVRPDGLWGSAASEVGPC
jgi:hypothetical protein